VLRQPKARAGSVRRCVPGMAHAAARLQLHIGPTARQTGVRLQLRKAYIFATADNCVRLGQRQQFFSKRKGTVHGAAERS